MASFLYDSTDFESTFGALPTISRDISKEIDWQAGYVTRERHMIRVSGHMVGDGATTPLRQVDLTAKLAIFEAFADEAAVNWTDNLGNSIWAYNDSSSANNHVCERGPYLSKSLPHGAAKLVTNVPYDLTVECLVQPCKAEPLAGIASLTYTKSENWGFSGLDTVTYSGRLCACDGVDARDLFDTLRQEIITPDAEKTFRDASQTPGSGFGPSSQSVTETDHDAVTRCVSWTLTYGGGGMPSGIDSPDLTVSASCSIYQNDVTLDLTGTYAYRGAMPVSSGSLFGTGGSAPPPIFGGLTGGFGGGLSGGAADFDTVKKEAFNHAGISIASYLPPGAGKVYLITSPRMSFDPQNSRISCTKTYKARWIHDAEIVIYEENIDVTYPRPSISAHRVTAIQAGDEPWPYVHTSGRGATIVRFSIRIVSTKQYRMVADRLTPDGVNIWKVDAMTHAASQPFMQQTLSGQPKPPSGTTLHDSRLTQTFLIRDLDQANDLKGMLQHGTVQNLPTTTGAGGTSTSGITDSPFN